MEKIYYWKDTATECFEGEIWKDIKGFEGYYQISTFGRVKSLRNNIIMRQRLRNNYRAVKLSVHGEAKHENVHVLVAKEFIPNSENKTQVNHIDFDKENNYIENLEWNTAKENTQHAHKNNLITFNYGESVYSSKFSNEDVKYIYTNPDNLTMPELALKFNVDRRLIFIIYKRNAWKTITQDLVINKVLCRNKNKSLI